MSLTQRLLEVEMPLHFSASLCAPDVGNNWGKEDMHFKA